MSVTAGEEICESIFVACFCPPEKLSLLSEMAMVFLLLQYVYAV